MSYQLETAEHPASLRRVAIDAVSRVEGHGKVTILLDAQNQVRQVRAGSAAPGPASAGSSLIGSVRVVLLRAAIAVALRLEGAEPSTRPSIRTYRPRRERAERTSPTRGSAPTGEWRSRRRRRSRHR